jgi:hypothetical protein
MTYEGLMRPLIALASLAVCSTLFLVVPSAGAQQTAASSTAVYTKHPTRLARGVNTSCPVGKHKQFRIVGKLQSGQTFVKTNPFYIRLQSGRTASSGQRIFRFTDSWYQWAVPVSRTAKMDTRLRLSKTTFSASGGATWTGVVSKICS